MISSLRRNWLFVVVLLLALAAAAYAKETPRRGALTLEERIVKLEERYVELALALETNAKQDLQAAKRLNELVTVMLESLSNNDKRFEATETAVRDLYKKLARLAEQLAKVNDAGK